MQTPGRQNIRTNQIGMAALVVVMVMMFVISVTVLGFAQVVRREQRNVLDHQLATQAYYAAESGLNLAQQKVKPLLAAGTPPIKDQCTSDPGYGFTPDDLQFTDTNAEITCVLIDPAPRTLEYTEVGMKSVPFLVKSSGAAIEHLYISWESPVDHDINGCTGSTNLVPGPSWGCSQPLLRVDIVPVEPLMDVNSVAASQFTTFLSPTTAVPPPISYGSSVNNINAVRCDTSFTPKRCRARIDFVSPGKPSLAVRVMSIYGTSNVTVSAESGTGPVKLIGGQVVIDVTARAADVLKRLQARMPVGSSTPIPDFAITSGGGVCKRYQISGGVPTIASDGQNPDASTLCATSGP